MKKISEKYLKSTVGFNDEMMSLISMINPFLGPKIKFSFWHTISLVILFFWIIPLWGLPLFFGVIQKITQLQSTGLKLDSLYSFFQFFYVLIPFLFAYGSLLVGFARVNMQRIKNQLEPTTLKQVFRTQITNIVILLFLQLIDITLNRLDAATLITQTSLSIFYFSTAIFMFFYIRIIRSATLKRK